MKNIQPIDIAILVVAFFIAVMTLAVLHNITDDKLIITRFTAEETGVCYLVTDYWAIPLYKPDGSLYTEGEEK